MDAGAGPEAFESSGGTTASVQLAKAGIAWQASNDSSPEGLFQYCRGDLKFMNKADLISAIADKAEISKADATRAVDAMFEVIGKALKKKDKVSLVGFGTFMVRERAARAGRNPKTGDTIKIKASKTPAFKAGKALKDLIK